MVPILGGDLCKPLGRIFQKKSLTGSIFPWKDLCVGKVNDSTPVLTYTSMDNSCRMSYMYYIYVLCRYSCMNCCSNSITVRTI